MRHLHACFVASTSHPSFGIQASNFDCIKPPCRLRHINIASKLWNSSHPNFGFVTSTSHPSIHLVSKLRNPSFDFRSLLQSMRPQRQGPGLCVKYMYREQWPLTWRPRPLSLAASARSHLERAPALLQQSTVTVCPLSLSTVCSNSQLSLSQQKGTEREMEGEREGGNVTGLSLIHI